MTRTERRRPRTVRRRIAVVMAATGLASSVSLLAGAQVTTTIPGTSATIASVSTTTAPPSPTTTTLPAATTTTTTTLAPSVSAPPQAVTASLTATGQITVTWQPPASTGNLPVQNYRVQSFPGDMAVTVSSGVLTASFSDLKPGTSYSFSVRATTAVGPGQPSPWTSPLLVPGPPAPPPPSAPHNVSASVSGTNQVTVSWLPGDPNGSAPVVAYRVVGVPGSPTQQVAANLTSATFANLAAGVSYSFTVRALAADGSQSSGVVANPVVVPAPAPPPIVVPAPLPLPGQIANPPGSPKPCVPYVWPAAVNGTPVNYRVGAPQGYYVYELKGYWYLRSYNPGPAAVIFSGSVTANAKLSSSALGLEKTDLLRRGTKSVTFSFRSRNDIDGIRLSLPCGTALTFRLNVNGNPISTGQIFVGRQAANPVAHPLVVVR